MRRDRVSLLATAAEVRDRVARLATVVALASLSLGCSQEPTAPPPGLPPTIPGERKPVPHQVIVVNTLSETLSRLDLESRTMTVQAAIAGTWVNRVTQDERGQWLLVTNSGANEIRILDPASLTWVGTVDLGTGRNPWTAVSFDGSRFLATNWLAGTIRRGTIQGEAIEGELSTQPGPEGVAVDGHVAWIACTNYRSDGTFAEGRVDVVDLVAWEIVASVAVGTNPQEVLVASDGRVHVLCTGAGSVHVLHPLTHEPVGSVDIGGAPGRMVEDPEGVVWVTGFAGGLRRYDALSLGMLPDPTDPALTGPGLSGVAADPVSNTLYVTYFDGDLLIEVDRTTAAVTDAWQVGDGPVDVLVQGE